MAVEPSNTHDGPLEPAHKVEPAHKEALKHERWELLRQVNEVSDKPMVALSFVWLALLVVDFTSGLSRTLELLSYVIWALFILDFLVEFTIAPKKTDYLRHNWLTAVALALPAIRVVSAFRALRALRAARALRGVRLLRWVTSLNRGMRALGATLARRGLGYVTALTLVAIFAGAAGMFQFERPRALVEAGVAPDAAAATGIESYGDAVWWTAMIMTTLGSEYWPKTAEGRILCVILSLYAFAVFGYLTATIASFFVGHDAAKKVEEADAPDALRDEVAALRREIARLTTHLEKNSRG
jgi:voltage-gated potassium channel